jgi:hypothetical protein
MDRAVAEDTKFDNSVGFSGSNLKSAIPALSVLRDLGNSSVHASRSCSLW